ncbi:hypothetical protein G6N76_13625 [Rhizobium daejeonense]|uniref:Biotin transporter BioY n=1 Tax=Rhizobium daejeonense TaxID=240521 RepID=A0A6M1S0R2_9HYPH|nr:hypothetical protein [Rhizobium daejeonense]NGO64705.1 hypothetical protein [Rhizobium daejeonense]
MNGLETAIRNALERSDRTNAETRARIYQSARQALESGLRKQNVNDPETVAYQRHRLETVIHAIELEERARVDVQVVPPVPAPSGPVPPVAAPVQASPAPASPASRGGMREEPSFAEPPAAVRHTEERRVAEPSFDVEAPSREADPWLDDPSDRIEPEPEIRAGEASERDHGLNLDVRPEAVVRRRARRGFYSRLFISLTLLAFLGMGVWWVYTSGVLLTAAERDTSVPNPPPHAEAEDFDEPQRTQEPKALDARSGFSDDWIEIFDPKQISAIRPRSNALVDVVNASDGTAVRVVSRSGDADGSVEITVPPEVLREMAGRTSTIALTLQSADDKQVQLSVSCDFDRMGDCARHRFTANPEKTDALFRVSFERAMAPGTPGRLVLNGDLAGTGRGINLYSVRVLPGE